MPNKTSERLKSKKSLIIQKWAERAHREIEAALQQSSLALNNSLGDFLDQIAEALSSLAPQKTEAQVEFDRAQFAKFARHHGESRAGMKDYTIEGLIREYHILRQTVCDVLEEDSVLEAREREIITSIIEQAVNDAASQYARILRDIREKFTATLVHDLKNPIAAAMMNAQMILRKSSVAEDCEKNANRILDRLQHASSMIDDVLDASRLSAGEKLSLPLEECNFGILLQRIGAEYEQQHPNRVRFELEGDVTAPGNPRALRRIIDNLVINALKYGAPNEPVIVSVRGSERDIVITVHNRGPAIPQEDQVVLFQQFRRTKSAGSKSGWGLGLVAVKGLTEAHGGTVRVESMGDETKFIVTIPKSRTAAGDSPLQNVG